eukprot:scaffold66038_cov55-Phaeocystis_antarctica.AAC.1
MCNVVKTNQRRRGNGLVSANVDGVHDAAPLGGVALYGTTPYVALLYENSQLGRAGGSLTPIHSLRHRRVRSRQSACQDVLGFLRF